MFIPAQSSQCINQTQPTITPRSVLELSVGQTGSISCTLSCQADQCPETVIVTNSQGPLVDIFTEVTLQGIVNKDSLNCSSSAVLCYMAFNISWTDNLDIRESLDQLQCVFIYTTGSMFCKTDNLTIVFSGKYNYSINVLYWVIHFIYSDISKVYNYWDVIHCWIWG